MEDYLMALILLPILFVFIIWERKKLIYIEYVKKEDVNIRKRYLILLLASYIIGLPVYVLFVKFLSQTKDYSSMHYVLLTPLYIAICALVLMLFEYMLVFVMMFIEIKVLNNIFNKHYKLTEKQAILLDKEGEEHSFKYLFFANCVGVLKTLCISMGTLLLLKLFVK